MDREPRFLLSVLEGIPARDGLAVPAARGAEGGATGKDEEFEGSTGVRTAPFACVGASPRVVAIGGPAEMSVGSFGAGGAEVGVERWLLTAFGVCATDEVVTSLPLTAEISLPSVLGVSCEVPIGAGGTTAGALPISAVCLCVSHTTVDKATRMHAAATNHRIPLLLSPSFGGTSTERGSLDESGNCPDTWDEGTLGRTTEASLRSDAASNECLVSIKKRRRW